MLARVVPGAKAGPPAPRPELGISAELFASGEGIDFTDGDDARNPEGSVSEIRRYLATGVDGFFTDDPGLGRMATNLEHVVR